MDAGNFLRERLERGDAIALLAILRLTTLRQAPERPTPRTAYILRSLKHPAEVATLRHVYGPNFFLISAYSPLSTRADYIERQIRLERERQAAPAAPQSAPGAARDLIERDLREVNKDLGQRLGDTFPKADFFVDARHRDALQDELRRFVELMFEHPFHTPTKHENAMFHAQAAALRSAAPGRQVGCAITDADGDILCLGANEVPKAGGGQYWSDDAYDARDHNRDDPDISGTEKRTVIEQILRTLKRSGWLRQERESTNTDEFDVLLTGLRVKSLIEFERVVHAEMAAVVSAARRGVAVRGTYAYTTTFPCHECTRHLIAAGLARIYYIEPYPKSLAQRLHDDAIVIDPATPPPDRVALLPFVGVAPRRYMELFTNGPEVRRSVDGVAPARAGWQPKGVPAPPTEATDGQTEAAGNNAEEPLEETKLNAPDPQSDAKGGSTRAGKEVEQAPEADLGAGDATALSSTELSVEMSSDALYILREGNVLVELDEALQEKKVELREDQP